MVFLVLFLSFISAISSNVILWWCIFLFMTIFFLLFNKSGVGYFSFNYFVLQEVLGLLFLMVPCIFQFFVLMLKVGVAPLHYWVFNIMSGLSGYTFMWFLSFQKVPFFFIMTQLFWYGCVYLLIFGIFFCYIQIFFYKSYKKLLFISSAESFNWVILMCFYSLFNVFFLFFIYFFVLFYMIFFTTSLDFFYSGWEMSFIFLNFPFSVTFFIKILALDIISLFSGWFILILLFFMVLSIITFSFWLINLCNKFFFFFVDYNVGLYFFIYFMMFIFLI